MSKLNISENLFLGVNELNRFIEFLKDDGYKRILKQIVKNYGIVKNSTNSNFVVTKIDDNSVEISEGLAFNENLDAIVLNSPKTLTLQNNVEHYICIRYAESHLENGTVNISANGILTGSGTEFTKVLRGQPNFPTKIKFYGSVNNNQEYEVVSVTDNSNAKIVGDFVAENNLKYSVIGTFTPGAIIEADNKEIYSYDDCEVFVIDGDELTIPVLNNGEYFIAKITYSNSNLYVNDIRYMNIFNAESVLQSVGITPFFNLVNVLPKGLNSFTVPSGNVNSSLVELLFEFCYKIISFTINGNSITINNGKSNKYSIVNDIPDGVFNNCLLYNKTNNTRAIISNFTSRICTLIDSNIQITQNDELYIIPNANEIEIEIINTVNSETNYEYPIHFRAKVDDCYLRVLLTSEIGVNFVNPKVLINYRLINNNVNTLYYEMDSCNYFDGIDSQNKLYTNGGIIVKTNTFNS